MLREQKYEPKILSAAKETFSYKGYRSLGANLRNITPMNLLELCDQERGYHYKPYRYQKDNKIICERLCVFIVVSHWGKSMLNFCTSTRMAELKRSTIPSVGSGAVQQEQKDLYKNIHNSFIHSSQKLEINQQRNELRNCGIPMQKNTT